MKKKRVIVLALGSAAVLTIAGLGVPVIRYRQRETQLIDVITRAAPPGERGAREAAVSALGKMRSARCIPFIIAMWDEPVKEAPRVSGTRGSLEWKEWKVKETEWRLKEHIAGFKALALIGEPAIPFLRKALRGGMEARAKGGAVCVCRMMGPAALPLLPDLLEWYRREPDEMVVGAIRAIGEPESVKEVTPKARLPRWARLRWSQRDSTDGPDKRDDWPMLPLR
jgi:hypothetical protein